MAGIVLVGEANPYSDDPTDALYHLPRGAAGDRLREHLGLRDATYAAIAKVNLCGREWSRDEARASVARVLATYDVVVALGRRPSLALTEGVMVPFFHTVRSRGRVVVTLPHPSGLNREWNEPDARARARAVMRVVAPDVPWGELDAAGG